MSKRDNSRKGGGSSAVTTVLLIVAIAVFCFAAYKLIGYYLAYKAGTDEYQNLSSQYVQFEAGDDGSDSTLSLQETQAEESESEESASVPGAILDSVEELEDPDTVKEKVARAAREAATEDGQEEMLPILRNPIDFDELAKINTEVIGWLRVGALDLSYPVAQAADNDYYLHRTFKKEDNFAGCIFLNCDNSRYFTDQNSIVYGHNMKNGSMFGKLRDFREQETYDRNPYFWIFTPSLIYQYRIFSCHEVPTTGEVYLTRFTKENYAQFIEDMQTQSLVDNHGVTVDTNDRIVTLSTCTGNDTTRFVVQGKLEQVYLAADTN